MKLRAISIAVLLFCSMFGTSLKTYALSFEHSPTLQTSNQWLIKTEQVKRNQPQGINHQMDTAYNLTVKSIGKDAKNVRIEGFWNQSNSTTKHELFTTEELKLFKDGEPFLLMDFLLPKKAKKLEITVTWTEEERFQKLKETFIFGDE